MVAYIAPWCGHCKTLVPEYSTASDSLSPMIPFYAVDCDADENKGICAKEGVKGFPTIKVRFRSCFCIGGGGEGRGGGMAPMMYRLEGAPVVANES